MYRKLCFLIFVLALSSAQLCYGADPRMLKLDFNNTGDNTEAETEPGELNSNPSHPHYDPNLPDWIPFIPDDSGDIVNSVQIDLLGANAAYGYLGEIESRRRANPYSYPSDMNNEQLYRDFLMGAGGGDHGITIELWGLGVNREVNIAMWAYDDGSVAADGHTPRVSNWYANAHAVNDINNAHIFDTNFYGGDPYWPLWMPLGEIGGAGMNWGCPNDYKWSAVVTADYLGRIILTSEPAPQTLEGQPFAFVNGMVVEPNGAYTATKYAHRPQPRDEITGVPKDVSLSWREGDGVSKHDVYIGLDANTVADANRASHPNLVIYAPDETSNSYDPFGPTGYLDLDTTYYWRVDQNDGFETYKGEVWSFTTWRFMTYEEDPTWRVDARCFLDGPSGAFDDIAVKDPSIVYSGGKWHLFYTGRDSSMWRMGYASATSIAGLKTATHTFMSSLNGGSYFCAPQVFWFGAKGKWYLIYQSGSGATFSTNIDVDNPSGWTAGQSMGFSDGIDFWCISDGSYVYCFYSPMDGSHTIRRRSTTVANFPTGWSSATVVVADTFEAPHVYKNKADGMYYMMVEDMGATRWQELWTASNPGGTWTKVSEQWAHPSDLIDNADHWTDQVSHGEILREGTDERMEIHDIGRCEILIQGVVNGSYGDYSNIPYDLGIIRHCPAGLGDLDDDCDVDFVDFAVLALQWQQPPDVPSADIAPLGGDGIVDVNDLGLLVDSWLWGK